MENQERKILIEVSQEEYEKIKAGALEENIPTYEDVRKDVLEKLSADDISIIMFNYKDIIADSIDDEALICQILTRSQTKSPIISEKRPDSLKEYLVSHGVLQVTKRDRSSLYLSDDKFEWVLREALSKDPSRGH